MTCPSRQAILDVTLVVIFRFQRWQPGGNARGNRYPSGFDFNSPSCSLRNARSSSVIASSFVHCSL